MLNQELIEAPQVLESLSFSRIGVLEGERPQDGRRQQGLRALRALSRRLDFAWVARIVTRVIRIKWPSAERARRSMDDAGPDLPALQFDGGTHRVVDRQLPRTRR